MPSGVINIYKSTKQSAARFGFVSMEMMVRPWVPVESTPTLRDPTPPQEVLPEATIRWGAESEFAVGDSFRELAAYPSVRTEDDDDEPERKRLNYSEEGRGWKDYRVENPNDPDQYVIVRACTAISLRGPSGEQALFNLSSANSLPNQEEGDGQTPPTPPLNEIE